MGAALLHVTSVLLLVVSLMCGFAVQAGAQPPYQLEGQVLQGGLVFGKTVPGSRVYQDGQALRVSAAGDFLLGFTRDAPPTSQLRIELPAGEVVEQTLEVGARAYDIQRIDGLPQGKVTPRSKEDLARIRRDGAAVKKARARDDDRQDFLHGFQWPVMGPITGVYGSQRILNGEPRRPHFGVDVAAPVGTPVRAPAAGIVTLSEPDQ